MCERGYDSVVFDLGGVLIDWNPRHLFRKLLRDDASVEHFLSTVCTRSWYVQHDQGLRFSDGVAALVEQHPDQAELIRAFDQRWAETLGEPIADSVSILDDLRAHGVPLYALTNWPADKFVHARERYEFVGWFRGIVVSGEERVCKPDPKIFRILLERYQLEAARTVFIDDSPENAAAATDLGMRGIHFRSPEHLARDLDALGLL